MAASPVSVSNTKDAPLKQLSPNDFIDWKAPGSDVTRRRTLLMVAAFQGCVEVLEYLLSCGSDPNCASPDDGYTALHCAAEGGSARTVDVIQLLLKHGADRERPDANGRRAVDLLSALLEPPGPASGSPQGSVAAESSSPASEPSTSPPADEEDDSALYEGPEYKTPEFRMYSFKIDDCPRTCAHDWTECPFAHPTEKARRRDPRKHFYNSLACPDFRKGSCKRGDACEFAHGVFECWLHPSRYRTQVCKDGAACTRKVCFFAHNLQELRQPVEEGVSAANGSATITATSPGSIKSEDSVLSANSTFGTDAALSTLRSSSSMAPSRSTSSELPMSFSVGCRVSDAGDANGSAVPLKRVSNTGSSGSVSNPDAKLASAAASLASILGKMHVNAQPGSLGLDVPSAFAQQSQQLQVSGMTPMSSSSCTPPFLTPPVSPAASSPTVSHSLASSLTPPFSPNTSPPPSRASHNGSIFSNQQLHQQRLAAAAAAQQNGAAFGMDRFSNMAPGLQRQLLSEASRLYQANMELLQLQMQQMQPQGHHQQQQLPHVQRSSSQRHSRNPPQFQLQQQASLPLWPQDNMGSGGMLTSAELSALQNQLMVAAAGAPAAAASAPLGFGGLDPLNIPWECLQDNSGSPIWNLATPSLQNQYQLFSKSTQLL